MFIYQFPYGYSCMDLVWILEPGKLNAWSQTMAVALALQPAEGHLLLSTFSFPPVALDEFSNRSVLFAQVSSCYIIGIYLQVVITITRKKMVLLRQQN